MMTLLLFFQIVVALCLLPHASAGRVKIQPNQGTDGIRIQGSGTRRVSHLQHTPRLGSASQGSYSYTHEQIFAEDAPVWILQLGVQFEPLYVCTLRSNSYLYTVIMLCIPWCSGETVSITRRVSIVHVTAQTRYECLRLWREDSTGPVDDLFSTDSW